jgi:hypothetical protein
MYEIAALLLPEGEGVCGKVIDMLMVGRFTI